MSRPTLRLLTLISILALPAHAVEIERPGGPAAEIPQAATPAETPQIPTLQSAIETPSLDAAKLAAPAAAAANVAAQASEQKAAPAQAAAQMARSVASQAEAGLKPTAAAGDSKQAGDNIQQIIEGRPAASAAAPAVAGSEGSGAAPLAASSERPEAATPRVPAPVKSVAAQRKAYNATRAALAEIAAEHGVVASLPMMPAELASFVKKEASYKNAVISDIDDTLDPFNSVLSEKAVKAIVGVRKAGKFFAAITDRPDQARAGSTTKSAFETFSSIPKEERAGIVVATNGGGKIYEYDASGEPKLIFSESELDPAVRAKVNEAAEVVKKAMADQGIALKSENPGPFGHSIIFGLGTPIAQVKAMAHLMESEMRSRGLDFEVEPREAKNPTVDPPYITFSKLNKSLAVKHIAQLKSITADQALILGDSMYKPNPEAKADAEIIAKAEALSGQKIPPSGNAVDRNMELALPGALTLSVGATADPRMRNAWVIPVSRDAKGKVLGPIATHEILEAVGARRKGEEPPATSSDRLAVAVLLIVLFATSAFAMYSLYDAMTGAFTRPSPSQTQDYPEYQQAPIDPQFPF